MIQITRVEWFSSYFTHKKRKKSESDVHFYALVRMQMIQIIWIEWLLELLGFILII